MNRQIGKHLPTALQLCNLTLRNFPLRKPAFGRCRKRPCAGGNIADGTATQGSLILVRKQVFLLRSHQFRAIYGKERLAFSDILIGCIREDFTYGAGKSYLNIREEAIIDCHASSGAQIVAEILVFRCACCHADVLHLFRGQLHRRKRRIHLLRWCIHGHCRRSSGRHGDGSGRIGNL